MIGNKISLTKREQEILSCLVARLSNEEIAAHFTLALSSVKWYVRQILNKLGADNRRQAVEIARLRGLVAGPSFSERSAINESLGDHFKEPSSPSTAREREQEAANRSLTGINYAVPSSRTSFIGREQALDDVFELLADQDIRLVTLIGPPGVGKTRLAIKAAEEMRSAGEPREAQTSRPWFKDGAAFVELSPLMEPSLVEVALARALGLRPENHMTALESARDFLHNKTFLLIFDNFEHVLDATALVSDLLLNCPHLKIIVTSRQPLHIYGEQEFLVTPLDLPDPHLWQMLPDGLKSEMLLYPAIRLFVQRTQAVKPGFTLSAENARAVIEICTRLDGLPLAIELAAARMKLWSPAILLDALNTRLPFLANQARDQPPRHQTIYGAIDWSWQLLAPEERAFLARLGVFAGSFTAEAAALVCTAPDGQAPPGDAFRDSTDELLVSLVDKSLVQAISGARNDGPHFLLLESVRAYAIEKLQESGEYHHWHARHAGYFFGIVYAAEPALRGSQVAGWLKRLDDEIANIRAAISWALDGGNIEAGLRAVPQLLSYWHLRGPLQEGGGWLERALGLAEAKGETGEILADILGAAGALDNFLGNYERSYQRCKSAMEIWKTFGNMPGMAKTVFWLAWSARSSNHDDEFETVCKEGISFLREAGEQWYLGFLLWGWGETLISNSRLSEARTVLEESVLLYRDLDNVWGLSYSLHSLAKLDWLEGDRVRAGVRFEEAFRLKRLIEDYWGLAGNLRSYGLLQLEAARSTGDFHKSEELFQESLRYFRHLGTRQFWAVPRVLLSLGQAAKYQGEWIRAVSLVQEAFSLCREWKLKSQDTALCLWELADLAMLQGQKIKSAMYYGTISTVVKNDLTVLEPEKQEALTKIHASMSQDPDSDEMERAWEQALYLSIDEIPIY